MEPRRIGRPVHRLGKCRDLASSFHCVNSVSQNLYSIRRDSQPCHAMNPRPESYSGRTGVMAGTGDIQNLYITNMADSV